jgi:hypothetical protein
MCQFARHRTAGRVEHLGMRGIEERTHEGAETAHSSDSVADDWKHPLQTVTAYVEAIGRWTRQNPVNFGEIEAALIGIEAAVEQARCMLQEQKPA